MALGISIVVGFLPAGAVNTLSVPDSINVTDTLSVFATATGGFGQAPFGTSGFGV